MLTFLRILDVRLYSDTLRQNLKPQLSRVDQGDRLRIMQV